ncbi:MAG: HEAT repeat domain-containing protein [Candidatus Heimdallarchaeota archaeon]|nr:HEAT repeat domain-containing protein [Candidatus Heimdallarchaeota archaeon]MCK4955066.1 HEAT repeat domain-containing protein [Candidatus Heimdallarchaeota archaeon]
MSLLDFFRGLIIGSKKKSEDPLDRAYFSIFLERKGKAKDITKLYPLLEDSDWNVRNAAASAIINLTVKFAEVKEKTLELLHNILEKESLAIKLSILEVLGQLKDYTSKPYLVKILEESDYDLQYAAIRAIGYLDDADVLYPLNNVVYAKDYITRRAAILSVIRITDSVEEEKVLEQLTPHTHLLIESYLELEALGDIIHKILDYGDPESFPKMKGYNETEIVKLEGLIEQKDYSVEIYQNFAKLIFPVYFPIDTESN